MLRKPIAIDEKNFPAFVRPLLQGALLYDSSCSPEARVFYIDKDGGYYLKRSPKGTLEREAHLTRYFHTLGLAPEMLAFRTEEDDWLLTAAAVGEDATHERYLSEPTRLCDLLAECLRALHSLPWTDCPIRDRTADYLRSVREGHRLGRFDPSFFPTPITPEQALATVEAGAASLERNTLLHGDCCLPNLILDDWRFSAFIDLGGGGVGDRHIDLFWGAWTLAFNLNTDRYRERFFDAYGRELIDEERLRLIAAAETFG